MTLITSLRCSTDLSHEVASPPVAEYVDHRVLDTIDAGRSPTRVCASLVYGISVSTVDLRTLHHAPHRQRDR